MSKVDELADRFLNRGSNKREITVTELVNHFSKFVCADTPVFGNIQDFLDGNILDVDIKSVKITDSVSGVEYGYYDGSPIDIFFILIELLAEYDEIKIVVDNVEMLKLDPLLYHPLYTWDSNGGESGPWVYSPRALVIPNDFTLNEIEELIRKVNMEDDPIVILPVKEEFDANEISEFYGKQNVKIFSPSKVREKIAVSGFEDIPKSKIAYVSDLLNGSENKSLKAFIDALETKKNNPKQASSNGDTILSEYYKLILEIYYRISSKVKKDTYLYVDLVKGVKIGDSRQFGDFGLSTILEILAVVSVFKNIEIIFPDNFDPSLEQIFVNAICEINSGVVGSLPNRLVRVLKMRNALRSPMSVLVEDNILLNTKYYKGSLLGVRGNADCYVIPLRRLYPSIESRNFGKVGVLLSTVKKTSELQFTDSSRISESDCVHLMDPTFIEYDENGSKRFQDYKGYDALRQNIIENEVADDTPFPFPKDFSGASENSFREVEFSEKNLQESKTVFEDSLLSQIESGYIDIDGYVRDYEVEDDCVQLRLTDWICNPDEEAVNVVRQFARDLFPANSFEQEPNEEIMVRRLLGIDFNGNVKSLNLSSNKNVMKFSNKVCQKQIEIDGAFRSIRRLESSTHEQIEFYSALCLILSQYLSKELRPDGKRYNYITINDLMLGVKDLEDGKKELYIVFYPMRETYPCWVNNGAAVSVKNAELGIIFPNNLSIDTNSEIIDNFMTSVISDTKTALKNGNVSFYVNKDFTDFEIFMKSLLQYDDTGVFGSDEDIRVSVYNNPEYRKFLINELKESVEWENKVKQQLLTLYFFATKYVSCKIKCLNELYEQGSISLPDKISFDDLPSVMEWNTANYYNAIGSRNLDKLNEIIPVKKSIDLCRVINPFGGILRDDTSNPGSFTSEFENLKFLCMSKVGNNGTRQPINGEFK